MVSTASLASALMIENPDMSESQNNKNLEHEEEEEEESPDDVSDLLRRRHQQFIECLERHGPKFHGDEWSILANDLGWKEEEVQRYAYEYLSCLVDVDDNDNTEDDNNITQKESFMTTTKTMKKATTDNDNNKKRRKSSTIDSSPSSLWSPSECVLFDTLVAVYKEESSDNNSNNNNWAESVAGYFPSKSSSDVKKRFHDIYDDLISS